MDEGAFQVVLVLKNLPANEEDTRDAGLIPGPGRSPGGAHGNPLQYSFFFFFSTPVFLPGESSWTEDPGELQSIGLQRVGHD